MHYEGRESTKGGGGVREARREGQRELGKVGRGREARKEERRGSDWSTEVRRVGIEGARRGGRIRESRRRARWGIG